jgi:hypothetical protein
MIVPPVELGRNTRVSGFWARGVVDFGIPINIAPNKKGALGDTAHLPVSLRDSGSMGLPTAVG